MLKEYVNNLKDLISTEKEIKNENESLSKKGFYSQVEKDTRFRQEVSKFI